MKIKIKRAKSKYIIPAISFLLGWVWLMLALPATPAGAVSGDYFDLQHLSEREEGYFILKDEATGEIILSTARVLQVGDQFVDGINRSYLIRRIEQDTAWAERAAGEGGGASALESRAAGTETAASDQSARELVGVYHSHGAESYLPSDGTESKESGGGIIEVGNSFTRALQQKGVTVEHITDTHVPHDAGAYNRSRRTATKLVADNLDAVFDVHRDAVPPQEYDRDINGRDLVQIMMVIGRQNQNVSSNKSFAEELKKVADSKYPGLIKGILLTQGSFNQDLSPRAMLIEVGAHTNSREQAEQSAALFADVVNTYLYAQQGQTGGGGIAAQGALKLLIALVIAIFIYLLISAGSWEEIRNKTVSFFSREFGDLGRGQKQKIKPKDDEPDS